MTSLGNRDFPEGEPENPAQFEEQAGDPPEWQRTKSGKPASVPPGQVSPDDGQPAHPADGASHAQGDTHVDARRSQGRKL